MPLTDELLSSQMEKCYFEYLSKLFEGVEKVKEEKEKIREIFGEEGEEGEREREKEKGGWWNEEREEVVVAAMEKDLGFQRELKGESSVVYQFRVLGRNDFELAQNGWLQRVCVYLFFFFCLIFYYLFFLFVIDSFFFLFSGVVKLCELCKFFFFFVILFLLTKKNLSLCLPKQNPRKRGEIQPKEKKKIKFGFEIEPEKPERLEHVVFVLHGIGQKLSISSICADVASFRKIAANADFSDYLKEGKKKKKGDREKKGEEEDKREGGENGEGEKERGRIEFIPIDWRTRLPLGDQDDPFCYHGAPTLDEVFLSFFLFFSFFFSSLSES